MYIGSLFSGATGATVVLQSAGSTDGSVRVKATGTSATVVSAFGVETTVPVVGGIATVPVGELPVYVRGGAGIVPANYGPNLARAPGVTITASGGGQVEKLNNGKMETWSVGVAVSVSASMLFSTMHRGPSQVLVSERRRWQLSEWHRFPLVRPLKGASRYGRRGLWRRTARQKSSCVRDAALAGPVDFA